MHAGAKVGISALLVVGSVYAFYHTASRRKHLSSPESFADPSYSQLRRWSSSNNLDKRDHASSIPDDATRNESRNQREATSDSQWVYFSEKLDRAKNAITGFDWKSLTDVNINSVLPDWSLGLPEWITKLQKELNMEPGSLADEVWNEARDDRINPEIRWDARVRISPDLCLDEKRFLGQRRKRVRAALARYLDIPEDEVHEDDVPIIGSTGSGGGLRAMVAGTGYYQALTEAGLFDCLTYTAGVSGACWLQAVYLSSLGGCSFERVVEHLKARVNVHIAYPPKALELFNSAPTNKYLLRGLVEKLKVGASNFCLVDLYGLLLAARLLVPANEMMLDHDDLKMSKQRRFIDDGSQPMPIYTMVRHEIPLEDDQGTTTKEVDEERREKTKKGESWFQWFEMTPYEFYSEDLEAGIPTWALGRRFENGINLDRVVPEMKLPFLLGVFGSAFCATLSHYYHEIRPFVVSSSLISKLDSMVLQRKEELSKVHPIDPASVPNYVKGLRPFLPPTCPESLHNADTIQLMDAGMSNNLACYPLMRPGRDVDILIAFDSSAEIQTANWISYAEGYAKQRKIQGWPISIGWPQQGDEHAEEELSEAMAKNAEEAQERLEDAQKRDDPENETDPRAIAEEKERKRQTSALGPCTVWVGNREVKATDEEPPPSRAVEDDWELTKPEAGITVVYMPLIPHENVPGVDPEISPYLSTWNFEWSPEQIDSTIALAKTNFGEGAEQIKRTVRAVYERKKRLRLEREARQEELHHEEVQRRHGHEDQFS